MVYYKDNEKTHECAVIRLSLDQTMSRRDVLTTVLVAVNRIGGLEKIGIRMRLFITSDTLNLTSSYKDFQFEVFKILNILTSTIFNKS